MKDPAASRHEVAGTEHVSAETSNIGVEQLFRDHAGFVAGFLHRLGVPAADIDDLVQEVFVVAHQKRGYAPGPASPRSWLGAITVRVAANARRARTRGREQYDEVALQSAVSQQTSPEEAVAIRDAMWRVQRALDALDFEHRATFILYEIEGISCQEIAASFDIPVGTVYSRLHTARQRFLREHAKLVTKDIVRGVA